MKSGVIYIASIVLRYRNTTQGYSFIHIASIVLRHHNETKSHLHCLHCVLVTSLGPVWLVVLLLYSNKVLFLCILNPTSKIIPEISVSGKCYHIFYKKCCIWFSSIWLVFCIFRSVTSCTCPGVSSLSWCRLSNSRLHCLMKTLSSWSRLVLNCQHLCGIFI